MSEGWICPKCRRSLAPWMSECPCNYMNDTITTTNVGVISIDRTVPHLGFVPGGRCPYVCDNKTDLGYCRTSVCMNPAHRREVRLGDER